MKLSQYAISVFVSLTLCQYSFSQSLSEITDGAINHLSTIYHDGKNELQIPVYTYHFPFGYDREIYDQLNPWPLGIGFGKGLDQPDGRWSGFYFLTFSDSHHDQQPSIVYSQSWPIVGDKQSNVSIGFVGFITARSDTMNYFPFPGALPMISASPSESLKITFTYVPSFTHGTGNVTLFTTTYRY
jgi:lipid IVA palmitoyltransferase